MEEGTGGEEEKGQKEGCSGAWLAPTAGLFHGAALRMQPSQPASKEGEYAANNAPK